MLRSDDAEAAAAELMVGLSDMVLAVSGLISVIFIICIILSLLLHGFRRRTTNNSVRQHTCTCKHSFIHSFIHAPLGVRSAKRRRQTPDWMILSHVNCFIQGEVIGFQALLDSLHPRSTRASWWSPPVLQ